MRISWRVGDGVGLGCAVGDLGGRMEGGGRTGVKRAEEVGELSIPSLERWRGFLGGVCENVVSCWDRC